MNFENEEEMRKFLNDEPYFTNAEDFCIGNTLEEAGAIIRMIMESEDNVGMDA